MIPKSEIVHRMVVGQQVKIGRWLTSKILNL